MEIRSLVKKAALLGISVWAVAALLGGTFFRVESGRAEDRFIRERPRFGLASAEVSRSIASQQYQAFLQAEQRQGKLDTSPLAQEIVRSTAEPLIAMAEKLYPHSAPWKWEIHVVDDDAIINAWCMDGGKIVVYTGLLRMIRYDKDKLATVLGHEISHALLEHNRAQLSRSWSMDSAFWIISKSLKMGVMRAAKTEDVMDKSFFQAGKRKDEAEADLLGLELMAKSGFNPDDAIGLWRDFSNNSERGGVLATKAERFLSGHPVNEDRIHSLEKLTERAKTLAAKAPRQKSWLVDKKRLSDQDLGKLTMASDLYGLPEYFQSQIQTGAFAFAQRASGADGRFIAAAMEKAGDEHLDEPDGFFGYALDLTRKNADSLDTIVRMKKRWARWKARNPNAGSLLDDPALCARAFEAENDANICAGTVRDIRTMTEREGGRDLFMSIFLGNLAAVDARFSKAFDLFLQDYQRRQEEVQAAGQEKSASQ